MTQAVIPQEIANHRTEHLFLLIGQNPLPNYVAARLLLKPGGSLYLVSSTRTTKQSTYSVAQRIGDALDSTGLVGQLFELGVDGVDSVDIERVSHRQLS